ncbi:MAG: alpha/beta hydrolase [Deltaproteobacteria bacterium]|nr:alpha/beta hydrolase [Deltaproteobacteria bacterium]
MRMTIRGADWHYSIQGQGETVLFLHGGLDSSANYTRLLADLAGSFRVVAVDRRGHGRSTDTDAPYDYALMAEEVFAFTRNLALERFRILGYSDGANIGFHMASDRPDAVKALVAVSGNYRGLSGMSPQWLAMLPLLSEAYARDHMPKAVEQYLKRNPHPDFSAHLAKTKALWLEDVVVPEEKLSAIRSKTLIISGDRDIVLPEQAVAMHSLIPGASLMLLPDTGHAIFQDFAFRTPAEAAMPVIRQFLAAERV